MRAFSNSLFVIASEAIPLSPPLLKGNLGGFGIAELVPSVSEESRSEFCFVLPEEGLATAGAPRNDDKHSPSDSREVQQ